MRAALQNLCDCTSCDWACIGQTNYDPCDETCLKCTGRPARDNDCPWIQARAALSAPARNCDRFATEDEARKAFQEVRGHKVLADVELWDSMDEAGALVRWLFAPAEGGAK
jgi:hypothetical protein